MKKPVELIFELSKPGRKAYSLPLAILPEGDEKFRRNLQGRLTRGFPRF